MKEVKRSHTGYVQCCECLSPVWEWVEITHYLWPGDCFLQLPVWPVCSECYKKRGEQLWRERSGSPKA
jgi:hypothetical protein